MTTDLTVFQSRAGDRNALAIAGARSIADKLAQRLGVAAFAIGRPEAAEPLGWASELERARHDLQALSDRFEQIYAAGHRSIAATSRCAVSLATVPVVARHHPNACVVWFDAHADLNTPESSKSGYLGGMALSGPLGLWNSGLGAGLAFENLVLVGQRDMDRFEIELMERLKIRFVPPGGDVAGRLQEAIQGRPVYVHLDCDVLNPGIVPTEYVCDGGLSLEELQQACEVMARSEVVGVEIAEFQNAWTPEGAPVSPAALLAAMSALFNKIAE